MRSSSHTREIAFFFFCSKWPTSEVQNFAYAYVSELKVLTKSIKFNPNDPTSLHIEEITISDISEVKIHSDHISRREQLIISSH